MHMQASELNLSLLYSQSKQLHAGTCSSAVDLVLHVLSLCDACRCDVQCCLRTRLSEQCFIKLQGWCQVLAILLNRCVILSYKQCIKLSY